MAFRFSLFKTPKHRVFEHKPMYYDPQEERKVELEKMVEDAKSGTYNAANSSNRIRQGFRANLPGSEGLLRREALDRRIRLSLVFIFLAIVAYAFIEFS